MAADKTGFFEEAPGVRSMTRLTIFWMCVLATLVVGSTCAYLLWKTPDAAVIGGMGGILITIVVKAISAIKNRNGGDNDNSGASS